MREGTNDLPNVLRKYYEDLKISEHADDIKSVCSNFRKANYMDIENNRKLLILSLSGIDPFSDHCPRTADLMNEKTKMKKLWNFGPFERKIKEVLKSPADYVST